MGLPYWSSTVACNAVAKAVPTEAVCGVPAEETMLDAAPAVLLRLKDADVETPETVAITL